MIPALLTAFLLFHVLMGAFMLTAAAVALRPERWILGIASFTGIFIAYLNLHTTEVQLPALLILAFSFFFGFSRMERNWLIMIAVGVWIPVSEICRRILTGSSPASVTDIITSWMSLLLALAGSIAGSQLRSWVRRSSIEDPGSHR